MKVKLRNPDRELEDAGDRKVHDVLRRLGIDSATVLVIRRRELLTRKEPLSDTDEIEIRPVITGGSVSGGARHPAFCAFCRAARAQILGERLGETPSHREVARALSDEVLPAEIYAERSA